VPPGSHVMLVVHVVDSAIVGVECAAVWGYWFGRSWARWLVLAGCIFYLTSIKDLRRDWSHSHFSADLDVFGIVLAIYLLWYLHTHDVRLFFARRALRPATNK
jgi:hypothetical protein